MAAPRRGRSSPATTIALLLATVVVGVLVVAPTGALAASTASSAQPNFRLEPAVSGFSAYATWNGVNVATAANASSAFRMPYAENVTVIFYWSQAAGAAPIAIDDARLQIFYFGFALGTRDITTVGAANSPLSMSNWNTGPLQYILAGTYMLTASLLATNGSTIWSQSFWVNLTAPFYILALLPIVLIIIVLYEVYALCTCGKYDLIDAPKKSTGGGTPPAETSAPAPSTPPDSSMATPAPEMDSGSPPPGGSS